MNIALPESWVVLSVAAAGFQTLRFMLQKMLSASRLNATGATFARFVYSAPLIALAMLIYLHLTGHSLDMPSSLFFWFAGSGGLAQILATICVVRLFGRRNFAVGVTLSKTETVLAVLVGMLLLGEGTSLPALGAILIGVVGVVLLSTPDGLRAWRVTELRDRSAALGLGAGVLFAVSAVCYRGASLEIPSSDPVIRAGTTLAVVTGLQMIAMGAWLGWRDRPQLRAVWQARRVAAWVGLLSLGGSFCWFWAFTLQTAAYVKAVGQVELMFSLIASVVVFSERVSEREMAGIALLGLSILALVWTV